MAEGVSSTKPFWRKEGTAEAFIHESIQELGGVDVFVNNAIRPGLGGGLLDIDTVGKWTN